MQATKEVNGHAPIITDIALEIVRRGITPNEKERVLQLARDADLPMASVELAARRIISIVAYVNAVKNKSRGRQAQIDYLQQMVLKNAETIRNNEILREDLLPLGDQWKAADMRSIENMKSLGVDPVVGINQIRAQAKSEGDSLG